MISERSLRCSRVNIYARFVLCKNMEYLERDTAIDGGKETRACVCVEGAFRVLDVNQSVWIATFDFYFIRIIVSVLCVSLPRRVAERRNFY